MSKKIFELAGIIAVDGMAMAIAGLKDLDSQFKAAEKSFFKFGRQLSSAGAKLSTNLTAPIVGAAAAATLAAKSFGEYGDKILDMSNNTGLTTDAIQELKQVASDTGSDFESITDSVFKLTKSMPQLKAGSGEASATLRALGINVFDANGKFRDTNSLFPEIIKKLQNITGATDRAAAAQAIFGKGGTALLDVLSMTNKEFDASRKKAHDLGLVMGGDALKAADEFRVGLNDATAQLVAMGRQATLELLPLFKDTLFPFFQNSLIPALKSMAEKVAELARWFNGLDDGLKKTILGAVAFAAAAGPILLIVGKIIGAIAGVTAAIKTMRLAMVGFSVFMGTNPLGIALIGIGLLTAAIIGVVSALDKIKKKKAEMAADKSYSASTEEEIADLRINIDLWRQRIDWLKAQKNPSIAMREELADMQDALKRDSEQLAELTGEATGGGVSLVDPEAEAERKAAVEAAKRKREEIARINAEYDKRLFDATIHSDQERYERERDLALIAVKNAGGDVALAYEAMEAEHTAKLRDAENERLRIKRESAEAAANREKEWTQKLVAQSGNRIALLKLERDGAIAAANGEATEIAKIKEYYRNEEKKAEKEKDKEIADAMMERVNNFMSMIGNIGSGIAGLFQQSTANRQQALDNQQQAERSAIESSTMSEKEKRKAIEALDKKQDAQQRAFRRKAAAESKKINIFESIMGTASAVIAALGSVAPPLNFIYAGIVGAIGAAKTALIAAQPLPLAKGALVQGGRGGILAQIGEASQDEIVLPVESGVKMLARRLRDTMRDFVPAPLTLAGAGGFAGAGGGGVTYHIGTFIGDDRGIKEFERRQLSIRNSEAQRKGQMA